MTPNHELCYLNGQYLPLNEARVPVLDRGFIFGDGIYEVVPCYAGKPFRLEQHFARFERSLREVEIANPMDRDGWQAMIARLLAPRGAGDTMIYWQVTRGVAPRAFPFPADASPTVFAMPMAMKRPSAKERDEGLSLVSWDDIRWGRCDIKATSLLGAVLARQYAVKQQADEVAQFRDGLLTEASSANLWIVQGGKVAAPQRDRRILEGIRYGFLAELCERAGIAFEERAITREQVVQADEMMLTGAPREVLPVCRLDGQPIGSGRPGPVYRRLRAMYDEVLAAL